MRAVVTLQVLNSRKADLGVEFAESLVVFHRHSISGIATTSSTARNTWDGRHPTDIRADIDSINVQIEQIYAEMKRKNYDPFD